ncbi:MAG: mannose-6-phosphate isomerase, class I [Actinomycetaceae bacterium]|nr:mannose-6-phosphate isomerase, class I [Actinomycetaceae bacterium]
MKRLQGAVRTYAWGSPSAIPSFFGYPGTSDPIAEVWFGAHPDGPAFIVDDTSAPLFDYTSVGYRPAASTETLRDYIMSNPQAALGESVAKRYNNRLPYLLKLIAPREPLSLQVHPTVEQAREGYEREDAQGIDRLSPSRNYRDRNHKPELTYALTPFDALAGFRAPRRVHEVIKDLDTPLARQLDELVLDGGVDTAFHYLLDDKTRPDPEDITQTVAACAARSPADSPSVRADAIVCRLAQHYPDDPGVIASLLLNPVTLRSGESLYIPTGTVHAYLSGEAVEIMAASDNVLRAGLTEKHRDVPEVLRIANSRAAPPIRIAPERMSDILSTFYVPVDDFELSILRLKDASRRESVRTRGPRTLVCIDGAVQVWAGGQKAALNRGQALFIPEEDGELSVRGFGRLVLASVP